jgi:hypothetical protein
VGAQVRRRVAGRGRSLAVGRAKASENDGDLGSRLGSRVESVAVHNNRERASASWGARDSLAQEWQAYLRRSARKPPEFWPSSIRLRLEVCLLAQGGLYEVAANGCWSEEERQLANATLASVAERLLVIKAEQGKVRDDRRVERDINVVISMASYVERHGCMPGDEQGSHASLARQFRKLRTDGRRVQALPADVASVFEDLAAAPGGFLGRRADQVRRWADAHGHLPRRRFRKGQVPSGEREEENLGRTVARWREGLSRRSLLQVDAD